MPVEIVAQQQTKLTVNTGSTSVTDVIDENLIEVISVPGVQGPPGVQNVHFGPVPPSTPQVGWIWVQTT